MTTLILAGLGAFAVWAVSLYAHPFRKCSRCNGSGRRPQGLLKRQGSCNRCRGVGRVPRIGSGLAHRTVLLLRAEYGRDRRPGK